LLLGDDEPEPSEARAIGADLVRLGYAQPEVLAKTHELLAQQLLDGLGAELSHALQLRLVALLGGISAGFHGQARDTILGEQEQIRQALLAERDRMEAALRRSEASLAAAQRIAHLGHWEWNIARDELHWSDEIYRIFGVTPREFGATLEAFQRFVHPDDLAMVDSSVMRAFGGKPSSVDHRIVRPDGETRVVQQQYEVLFDDAGSPMRVVGTVQDITERKALEERLQHQVLHDPLTGLPNRAWLTDRLEAALACTRRGEGSVALLYLDLDRLKSVNDSLGHEAGDELLVAVGERLKSCLRPGASAARLGGEEFVVLIEDVAGVEDVIRVAEHVLEALRGPFALRGCEIFVSVSIGIALGDADTDRIEDLVRNADLAMYKAKGSGKARYELYHPGMSSGALERLELENDLRRALEREELVVYYQPVARLATNRIVGMEALVRWRHPRRGLVLPAGFIGVAEETGLIVPMGRWVLEQACTQARAWQDRYPGNPPLMVSVNLSARQFGQMELVEDVASALRGSGLAASSLMLELTETVVMEDAEATVGTLRQLKGLGVNLAIDDFGTGYSSLSYLKRFLVGTLKIDRSFIDGLGTDPEDTAIVRAVFTLGQTLGMRVAAEGVETHEQLSELRALGCELGQGYYYWTPRPAGEAEALLTRNPPTPDKA
jgi:diguanylate cyclase (GGDEF)-like protein/PAS domain S-box-containing protein